MTTCTVKANDREWAFRWPGRPGAIYARRADVELARPPKAKPADAPPEEQSALVLQWMDYNDATHGLFLAAFWDGEPLAAMARRAHPIEGEQPAGDLWPLAKDDNGLRYGLAIVDELYALGWRPSEVTDAVKFVSAAMDAWVGPQPKRAEVDEARDFSEAPTVAPT